LKLELQQALGPAAHVAIKAAVLLAGWALASLAAAVALLLWRGYGGSTHAPEIAAVALGHFLNASLTIALAAAAAAIAEHPATAAILTLGFTVGTWIVNLAAAVRGGLWEQVAAYTPPAMVAEFQHGLVRLDLLLYGLAGVAPPPQDGEGFRGHPLAVPPRGAAAVFLGLWPALVLGAAVSVLRRTA